VAYFYNDPNIVYEIQTDGTVSQAAVGDEANITNPTAGSTTTGLSQCTLSSTLAGANNVAAMRIVDIAPFPDNAWGDSYVIVRATVAQFQFGQVRVSGANYTPVAV